MKSYLLKGINWYQQVREGRPSPCRFTPSCSQYAKEAIDIHGARRGSWLAVRRLVRCRPFGASGFDPVPESWHQHDADCAQINHIQPTGKVS
ncbi:MAG: membrane protein insertion efficiency factor YidD [Actinomycetes bacterium]